jgi:hypothetical protein
VHEGRALTSSKAGCNATMKEKEKTGPDIKRLKIDRQEGRQRRQAGKEKGHQVIVKEIQQIER